MCNSASERTRATPTARPVVDQSCGVVHLDLLIGSDKLYLLLHTAGKATLQLNGCPHICHHAGGSPYPLNWCGIFAVYELWYPFTDLLTKRGAILRTGIVRASFATVSVCATSRVGLQLCLRLHARVRVHASGPNLASDAAPTTVLLSCMCVLKRA